MLDGSNMTKLYEMIFAIQFMCNVRPAAIRVELYNISIETASQHQVLFYLVPHPILASRTRLQLQTVEAAITSYCSSREGAALPCVDISGTISPTVLQVIETDQRTIGNALVQSPLFFNHRVSIAASGISERLFQRCLQM